MREPVWKYARTRPGNFPTRRIAMLAKSVLGGFSLMGRILEPGCNNATAEALFNWEHDEGYWADHSDFGMKGARIPVTLSESARRLLAINLAAPMLYAYGAWRGDADLTQRGMDIWSDSEPENNSIIRQWKAAGIGCGSAAESQGLLQLRKEYCDRNRCLNCRFGHALLRKAYETV